MTVKFPTLDQLRAVADDLHLSLSTEDLESFRSFMDGSVADFALIDQLPDYVPRVKYPRTPGYRPDASENPFNAWYVKSEIKGASRGRLSGKTVAVKDNIAVAGVPMMNGSAILNGYIPDVDATVVTRLLDAGATILGKSQCEFYCFSAGSHTGAQGPVQNPHKAGHASGGSSSGSAALVANAEVDLALGGDQGGSIRVPAAYCGIVGMKPTWGLVPYTGAMPIELTLDHLGPMTRSVADNALMLEVLAGPDGLDPRQSALVKAKRYTNALDTDVSSLRIAVVKEGFGRRKPSPDNIGTADSEADVDRCVRKAAEVFRALGAHVEEISIPQHLFGPTIWTVIATEGATRQMMLDNGHGYNWKGLYLTSMIDAHSAWRMRADELPDTVKFNMLVGQYMIKTGRGRYYAKAQNFARKLREDYDRALAKFDILLMPTTPIKAPPLPPQDAPRQLYLQRAWESMGNTFSFDVTGHPALQVPCGMSDGLPIGMMLVGKHFDEMTLYRAGHAFEQSGDWKTRS
jgi:amidase